MFQNLPFSLSLAAVAMASPALAQVTLTQSHSQIIGGTAGAPPSAADVAVLDLNQDGVMDIVAFNVWGNWAPPQKVDFLAICLGNGDGTFQPYIETAASGLAGGVGKARLMAGEFNGDTHLDLALTHRDSQEVALILNDGAGGLILPATLFNTGALVGTLHVDDYNADGLDDVLTVSYVGYNLSFLAGTGTGLATPVSMPSGLGSYWLPQTMDAADVDNDGNLDVVFPYQADETGADVNQAIIFTGNGDGTFDMGTPMHVDLGPVIPGSRTNLQVGDVDADGYQDIVAVRADYGGASDGVFVAYGNGTGWDTAVAYPASGQQTHTNCFIADIDFDGNLDITTVSHAPCFLEVMLGDGARNFVAQGQIDVSPASGMFSILATDVTDDEKLDIILGFEITGHLLVYRNDTPGVVTPGVGYCFGDLGSGNPCPCANDNDGSIPGSGCANGVFASGAQLTGSGQASISGDTLVLATSGLEPGNSGLYFQANNDLSPGIVWGDGLRCAGGQLKRLGVRFADASGYSDTSDYSQPISVKVGNVMAGDTKYYQCWYRNNISSPCASEFNQSNGYAVTWRL